jgi:hypothetical protein
VRGNLTLSTDADWVELSTFTVAIADTGAAVFIVATGAAGSAGLVNNEIGFVSDVVGVFFKSISDTEGS